MEEIMQLLSQAAELVTSLGSLPMPMKVASIMTLLISVWKLSPLQPYWDKLGKFKVFVAPVLGLGYAIFSVDPFTLANLLQQAISVSAMSIALHEVLDVAKTTAPANWLRQGIELVSRLLPKASEEEKKAIEAKSKKRKK